jgi:putative transport protein
MREALTDVLVQYPIVTLFVVIGVGYVLGEISFFGFRFGVAGVLFAGLAVGSLSPAVALPEFIASLGLIIFVYTMGIQSGPAFFDSFSRKGGRDSLLAAGVLSLGAALTYAAVKLSLVPAARAVGLFCGALTNTPALAATGEWLRQHGEADLVSQPVVGYSVAYPLGVIGVLLCFQLLRAVWQIEFQPVKDAPEIQVRDFVVVNPAVVDRPLGDVLRVHKNAGFVVSRIQPVGGVVSLARNDTILHAGDIVAVVGDPSALERAEQIFGAPSPTGIELDHSVLEFKRFFVSSRDVVGKTIGELDLPNRLNATITRVLRGDVDMVASPDMRLEMGDRVRVVTHRDNFAAVGRFFGDSVRSTAEADFASVAVGMVLGVLVGSMPFPMPGGGTLRLGLAGGPLLVALVLGKLERTGRLAWKMPVSANLTLRQMGLLFFLAAVGTRAGHSFVAAVRETGLAMLLIGAGITLAVTLTTLIFGYKFLKIPFDTLMGLMSGVQTQPACLSFAVNQSKSESPNLAYASVYPAAMIVKIILAQLLLAALIP